MCETVLEKWLKALIEEIDGIDGVEKVEAKPLHSVLQGFKDLIENDAEINMFFHQMFDEVLIRLPYNKSPNAKPQVRNYHQMLRLINAIMTRAPEFSADGIITFPIYSILEWSMGTVGAYAAFSNAKVNHQFKKILNEWGVFLKSKDSCYILNSKSPNGWFCEDARKMMPHFDKEFKCDPTKLHHGFTSWDDFFTREFRNGVRPIEAPNDDTVIVNACEAAPYKLATDVK